VTKLAASIPPFSVRERRAGSQAGARSRPSEMLGADDGEKTIEASAPPASGVPFINGPRSRTGFMMARLCISSPGSIGEYAAQRSTPHSFRNISVSRVRAR
jgi:hypothetical protein